MSMGMVTDDQAAGRVFCAVHHNIGLGGSPMHM
jgi:hypothetical protein